VKLSEFQAIPTETVELAGTTISYRRIGVGEPLLMIHGWPLISATYRKLVPRLSERFECILPDSPGLGESTWDETTGFHFRDQAKTWQAFTKAIGLSKYHVAAHDTGATIARLMIADEGERVGSLVMFDTEVPGHRPPFASQMLAALRMPGMKWGLRRMLGKRSIVESKYGFGYAYRNKALFDDEFYGGYVDPLVTSDVRWGGAMRYLAAIDWAVVDGLEAVHRKIACPVKIIWGERDSFFPISHARRMVDQFPDCRDLAVLPDAGLMSYEEQPDVAVDAMFEFADSLS